MFLVVISSRIQVILTFEIYLPKYINWNQNYCQRDDDDYENAFHFLVNVHVISSFLWSDFVKKCSEATAKKCLAKPCLVDLLIRRTLRLHQYFGLLPMMPPHQQVITLYGQYLLVRQYDQVQPFPQVDL